jgi:Fic-DOC domain mobile mystery protein B
MTILRNVFGTTPLDPDELDGLIPLHITTQAGLNEWEQNNIIDAALWLENKFLDTSEILTINFVKKLHLKMFDKTWKWAGKFRLSDKNIGSDWQHILNDLKHLLDDVKFHIDHNVYPIDEIVVRFHHRLVLIHPFVNGNGRLSRMITDKLLVSQQRPRFSWGMINIKDVENVRKNYISALRLADKHDYSLLLKFVRS